MGIETIFDPDDETAFLYLWFFKRDKVSIDNIVFYLHYHVSTALFFIGCLLVTVAMFIMDPIDCITDQVVDGVIDNYCLYHSTFTYSGAEGDKRLEIHPGLPSAPIVAGRERGHNYYLWTAIVLLLQAASFYIPRGLWKSWEGSRVQIALNQKHEILSKEDQFEAEAICSSSNENDDGNCDEERKEIERNTKQRRQFVSYILSKRHTSYYFKLLGCETLNFLNSVFMLICLDFFLGSNLSLNFDYLQLLQESRPFERSSYIEQMFPKVSSCVFYAHGPSGGVINYQALCVLSVNSINEKIFGVIYIWLLLLISLSALAICYRFLFVIPVARKVRLNSYLPSENVNYNIGILSNKMPIGNWQLLCQVCGNSEVDSWELCELVRNVWDEMRCRNI